MMNAVKITFFLAACLVLGLAGLAAVLAVSVAVILFLLPAAAYLGQMALILGVSGFWFWLYGWIYADNRS
jgi:hypothetical protein